MKNLIIINNEKCTKINGEIFCENIEIKSLSQMFRNDLKVNFILRESKIEPIHKIQSKNVSLSSNIFLFLRSVLRSIFKNKSDYLIVSVTPYTFLSFIILFLFRRKIFLYLRSDVKKETTQILGKPASFIFKILELIMMSFSEVIAVNKTIIKKKHYHLVTPSQLDNKWFENTSYPKFDKIKLLYIGRVKIEKGIFSLIEIFKKIYDKKSLSLTIIGKGKKINNFSNNISFLRSISEKEDLIKKYDEHAILILPSYTEGYPQVLIESLARRRPVIIFNEIEHVKKNYKGVFISNRDPENLLILINKIISNYSSIFDDMGKNNLPTRSDFEKQLNKIFRN